MAGENGELKNKSGENKPCNNIDMLSTNPAMTDSIRITI
jgi:hypothetical protein